MLATELLFVYVYCLVDDAIKAGAVMIPRRPGPVPACTDAELLTIALVRHLLRRRSENGFLREVRRDWLCLFPHLPDQPEVNRRTRWLWGAFEQLRAAWAAAVPADPVQQVDTSALPVRHPSRVRGPDGWTGPGNDLAARFGRDGAHAEWFYGFRRSSKLIHGGLRYLEQRDFKLVREALHERDLLISRLAPHLVHPVPFLYPLYKKVLERPYVGAGLALYDAMEGPRRPVPFHRHLTTKGAARKAPALRTDGLAGAMTYYDAQVDDARYTLTVARTAAAHGALVVTRATVESLRRSGDRITGARVRDPETGRLMDVTAARVVVCAGVWTDWVLGSLPSGYTVRMSKGVHIVVPRDAIDAETGMILRTERSVLFLIPWDDRWIVGTTDTDWAGDPVSVTADETDVAYILSQANRVLARPLTRADVLTVYAGLRPLVDTTSGGSATTRLSREHVVDAPVSGLVTIAGGKFTTYRIMARDVIDMAVEGLGRDVPGSVTDQLPLLGTDGLPGVRASVSRLAEDHGVSMESVEHLIGRYGSMTPTVLGLIGSDDSLRRPLADRHPYLRAEVAYAVRFEGALRVEDVLARRTRLLIESADRGVVTAPAVAAVMGGLLGWGRRRRAEQVREYAELADGDNAALDGAELSLTAR